MRADEILGLSVVPDVGEPSIEQEFLLFARATVDSLRDQPDVALDLSRRLEDAGLASLSRSLRVLSERARYPSNLQEHP